jgi:hypothetical protein
MKKILMIIVILLSFNIGSALAEDANAIDKTVDKNTTEAAKIRKQISDFSGKLDGESMQHFMTMYTGFNMIEAVKLTQSHVAEGIESCGENNPDMKDELQTRHKDWKSSLKAPLKEADGNIKNMMIAQDYAESKEIKSMFKSIQKIRTKANKRFERIPVTSTEGCAHLLDKMDETQEELLSLLDSILLSRPAPAEEPQAEKEAEKEDDAESEE